MNFAETIPLRDMPIDDGVDEKSRFAASTEDGVAEKNAKAIRLIAPNVTPDCDGALDLRNHGIAPDVLPRRRSSSRREQCRQPGAVRLPGRSAGHERRRRSEPLCAGGEPRASHLQQERHAADPAVKFSTHLRAARHSREPARRWRSDRALRPDGGSLAALAILVSDRRHDAAVPSVDRDLENVGPAGAYYIYDFIVSDGNNEFNDYPHFGVWPDGYYMSNEPMAERRFV